MYGELKEGREVGSGGGGRGKRRMVCVRCLALVRGWDFLVSALGVAGKRRRTPSDQCSRIVPAALRRGDGEREGRAACGG